MSGVNRDTNTGRPPQHRSSSRKANTKSNPAPVPPQQTSCPPPPHIERSNPIPSSATPPYDPVGIFWDYENCAPSTNASGYSIADNIRTLASQFGAVNIFKAYFQLPDKSPPKQSTLRSELQSCGLSLTDCPHNGKNSVDLMMIVDIMAFIKDNPPPATVILISSDRDFAYLLSTVRWRKYNVVLISDSSKTHESLTTQASVVYDWTSDILNTRPPPKPPLLGPLTSSSVASPTTPRELDNITRSDTHLVGPLNQRVVPAIQPLTPSPRRPRTASTSRISSTRVTVPLDAPSAELGATPLPPTAGTPIKAVSASIPMNSTPDNWTVADFAGGPPTDLDSPQTVDPVDGDGLYSPVLSSPELTLFGGEGDIPSSPGHLLLFDEKSPVGPSTHNLEGVYPLGTITPGLRARELKTHASLPALTTSQTPAHGVVGCHQVEFIPCKPSASLPVVPPSELSPTREVPLNALASTFVPETPRFSCAEIVESPSKDGGERGFEDLIAAVEQRRGGDGWVTLRHQRDADPNNPSQHTLSQHSQSQFRDSIQISNNLRFTGDPEPQFSSVGLRLLRKNPFTSEDAGVTESEEYVEAAAEAGVVAVRGVNGDNSPKHSPVYPSTSTRTTGTPPTLAAGAPPSFTLLVELLKSKRPANGSPISFTEVFVRLISTLGYNNIVSLCISVPGVTTFGQYIGAAVASGLVSLVGGTAASRIALVSLHDASPTQGMGRRSPDCPSPPAKPSVSTTPPPSLHPPLPRSCGGVHKGTFRHFRPSPRPRRSSGRWPAFGFSGVVPLLPRRKPTALLPVGVARFMDYVILAAENALVMAQRIDRVDSWMTLNGPRPRGPTVSLQFQFSKLSGGGMTTTSSCSSAQRGVGLVGTLGDGARMLKFWYWRGFKAYAEYGNRSVTGGPGRR